MSNLAPSEPAVSTVMSPTEVARLRTRLAVQRPLHWEEALRLIATLQAAWAERERATR